MASTSTTALSTTCASSTVTIEMEAAPGGAETAPPPKINRWKLARFLPAIATVYIWLYIVNLHHRPASPSRCWQTGQ